MMATSTTDTLPPPSQSILFARGVIARLAVWQALRIAVDQGWGGPDSKAKRTWMASSIVDIFEDMSPSPDDVYIEDVLLQMMEDEFETNLEDGSAESVAKDIVRIWDEVTMDSQELVQRYEAQAENSAGKKAAVQEVLMSDEDWESDDDEQQGSGDDETIPQLVERPSESDKKVEPEIDGEGFTLVKGKGKAHSKKFITTVRRAVSVVNMVTFGRTFSTLLSASILHSTVLLKGAVGYG